MMNRRKFLEKIINNPNNIGYNDFTELVESFGFQRSRQSGSHQIFKHPRIPELLNLQNCRGQVKPYQIRQFLKLIEIYNLMLEEDK